jgi:hypothetical protein
LVIITDDSNQYGKNARFDYTEACMDLPVGEHPVYTAPPHPRVEVTDEMVDIAMTAYEEFLCNGDEADYEAMRAAIEAALQGKKP